MLIAWTSIMLLMFGVQMSDGYRRVEDIKLLEEADLTNALGVTPTNGTLPDKPAYKFESTVNKYLEVNASVATMFATQVNLLKDFTVKAYLRTQTGGAIVSYSDRTDLTKFFSIVFRWKNANTAEITYRNLKNGAVKRTDIELPSGVSKDGWFYLTVRSHLEEKLLRFSLTPVNGKKLYKFSEAANGITAPFPTDGKLRVAQNVISGKERLPEISARFEGDLQDVLISFGSPNCSREVLIVKAPTTTPKICTTRAPDDSCTDEKGQKHQNNEKWSEEPLVRCHCKNGNIRCWSYGSVCEYDGTKYVENKVWEDRSCQNCVCKNGQSVCQGTGRVRKTGGCPWRCSDDRSRPCPHTVYDGCFCPDNKVLLNGKCQNLNACPCIFGGQTYSAGLTSVNCKLHSCALGKFTDLGVPTC